MSHALATVLRDGRRPSANRRRQRSEFRPHPKEEAMSHALATVLRDGRRPSAIRSAAHPPESVRGVERKIRNPKSEIRNRHSSFGMG